MTEVFNNIRAECARKHMTLVEVTRRIGITRRTFYMWEEKGDISLATLKQIAEILNVSLDTLLNGKEM